LSRYLLEGMGVAAHPIMIPWFADMSIEYTLWWRLCYLIDEHG
jgi:hypothetical protein